MNALNTHPKFDPARLQKGGYVLYFRHASAEVGKDIKDNNIDHWWESSDPTLTRQLDAHGWDQALELGKAMRAAHVPVDEIKCSEFKRTQDTAFALKMGEVHPSSDLTPLAYDDNTLEARIEKNLNEEPDAGTNTILVAHGHVTELFKNLHEGDAAVFDPAEGHPQFVGFIDYQDWQMKS